MKASFFSAFAAASLFATTAFAAAPIPADHDRGDHRYEQQTPYDRYSDRNSKDFNYGFDKKHRVTAQERQRWEAAHRIEERKEVRYDERKDKDFNYGYAKNHRVSDHERQRWEAAHHYDGRR